MSGAGAAAGGATAAAAATGHDSPLVPVDDAHKQASEIVAKVRKGVPLLSQLAKLALPGDLRECP